MKKLMVIVVVGFALVVSQGFQKVAADEKGTPLRKLAGTYALTSQASFFLCFSTTPPFPLAECGSVGSTGAPFSALAVGVITFDAAGNWCATWTEADSTSPLTASPPTISVLNSSGKIVSYDPTTGTGESSSTSYFGGKCTGAVFDSTGATFANNVTSHIVVSNRGERIDTVNTSLTIPGGILGGFSVPTTLLRQ
ncbi:MAG: hypothetical protein HY267_07780 [Deltaproteobacteria bacterium]|nr:hypothetical protein [Deltaproteobacteria bacterium]